MTADPFGMPDAPKEETQDYHHSGVSIDEADRAIRRLGRLNQQLASIETWAANAKAKLEPKIHEAREMLDYFTECMREDTGESVMTLPSGEVSTRKRPAKVKRDNDKLLKLLGKRIEGAEFWKTATTPKWKEIMELVKLQKDGTYVVKDGGEVITYDVLVKTDPETKYSTTIKDSSGKEL